jgi:hypothetical protein
VAEAVSWAAAVSERAAVGRVVGRVAEMGSGRAEGGEWSESTGVIVGLERGCLGWETGSDSGSDSAAATEVLSERETAAAKTVEGATAMAAGVTGGGGTAVAELLGSAVALSVAARRERERVAERALVRVEATLVEAAWAAEGCLVAAKKAAEMVAVEVHGTRRRLRVNV